MMKTRLMKGRPRLVPPEGYQQSSSDVNMWIDEKESDITSVSSASSDDSEDSDDDSMMSDEEETGDHGDDTEEEEEEEEDDDEEESAMERTIDATPTEQTDERTVAKFNEVTPLFKAIIGEEWDSIVTFLETGSWGWKWSSLCAQLYQVSEKAAAAQVRTWVSATKKDERGDITRLPLHVAIAKAAPFKVIVLLVKIYSKGVKNPDSEGNYPLHLAFEKAATMEVMTYLMKEFPDAIHFKNHEGRLPAECGDANGISELMKLSIRSTKKLVEAELTKEKGNLEEDRKQLLEVTKELMNLKKIVAERERNMTKDNFLYQKQHLSSAISQLTKLKLDLDKHEDNVLKHHLVVEKKRMDGVLGELSKTKGELDKIKSEQNQTPPNGESPVVISAPATPTGAVHQKKKKSKKTGNRKHVVTNHHTHTDDEEIAVNEDNMKHKDITETTSAPSPGIDMWSGHDSLTIETDFPQDPEESRDPQDGPSSPRSLLTDRTGGGTPRNLKTVAARFKKKMNWRKVERQAVEAE